MFVICDWRNENAEGIYEMSHCFVACFTIFIEPAADARNRTQHTHTPQSCVLIVDKMWYKRHIPQLSPLMVEGALIANIILIHSYMSARNTPVTDLPVSSLICNKLHHRSHDNATRCGVPETGVPERQVTAASDSHSWVRLRKITRCG